MQTPINLTANFVRSVGKYTCAGLKRVVRSRVSKERV